MTISSPVIFCIFNRPDLTEQVFKKIREAKPRILLVVADGPRTAEEVTRCHEVRKIIEMVDWDCQVLTKYSDHNLGCGRCISSGLDWAFSIVEEAIILEDDCLPAPSFFPFCQSLLEYYRNDERIMHISGNNFQHCISRTDSSYYFSKYSHNWGWATWRRAWKYYDYEMKSWLEFKRMEMIETVCENIFEQLKWTIIFDQVHEGKIDTWDYQWLFTCWLNNGFSIIPNVNLVSNIGFGSDATHTTDITHQSYMLPISDIWHIKHPPLVIRHIDADAYTFDHIFGGIQMRGKYPQINKMRRRLSKLKSNIQKWVVNSLSG